MFILQWLSNFSGNKPVDYVDIDGCIVIHGDILFPDVMVHSSKKPYANIPTDMDDFEF
jgi:hypothetical protein